MGQFLVPGRNEEAVYELVVSRVGQYRLRKQFRYVDDADGPRQFVVPKDRATFETDLASIPIFATWLIPKDGTHTPAAILHDALGRDRSSARTVEGPLVSGEEADRIFRDAMGDLGVALLRRWMMWAAVSLRTMFQRGRWRPWYWLVIPVTLVSSGLLGLLTTGDLVHGDQVWRPSWLDGTFATQGLPWLVAAEPVLWGKRIGAGLIAAIGVGLLALPLVAAAVGFGAYFVVELSVFLVLWALGQGPNPPRILRSFTS